MGNRNTVRWRLYPVVLPAMLFALAALGGLGVHGQESKDREAWVGRRAAPIVLPGIDGKKVDIDKVIGKRPVVLVFYRGVW